MNHNIDFVKNRDVRVILDHKLIFEIGYIFINAKSRFAGFPTRALKQHRQLITEAFSCNETFVYIDVVVHLYCQRIKRINIFCQPIGNIMSLWFESAKNSIPYNENASVVLVNAVSVSTYNALKII